MFTHNSKLQPISSKKYKNQLQPLQLWVSIVESQKSAFYTKSAYNAMGGVLLNQDILNNPTLTANENCFPFSQLALHTDLIILSIDSTLKCGEFPDPVILPNKKHTQNSVLIFASLTGKPKISFLQFSSNAAVIGLNCAEIIRHSKTQLTITSTA